MLFRQLEYFVALAREQHFARAAEACYVSQPALSSAIAKLETELSVPLIYRDHSFQGLTEEGERLLIWANRILGEHDSFKDDVRSLSSGVTGTLRLGVIPTTCSTVAASVESFIAEHEHARVQITSCGSSRELARRLRDFELDAAIGYYEQGSEPGLDIIPLYEERYVLVVPQQLGVDDASSISWTRASQLPLAMLSGDVHGRQAMDDALTAEGARMTPQIETDSVASIYAHIDTGRWASILPYSWVRPLQSHDDIRIIPLSFPTAKVEVGIAVSSAQPRPRIARAFVQSTARLLLSGIFAPDAVSRAA